MRRSDFLPSVPGGSLTRPPVPSLRSLFRSRRRRALPTTGQGFGLPASPTGSFRYGENRISRVPVRSSRCMPCSHQTPVGPERQAIRRSRCCLPLVTRRRLPRVCDFGAQSHGLHLRCLRFATAVTRAPRKTRFRAVASLTRAGLDPQDLFGRFPSDSSHVISSPFPELCSAHATYTLPHLLICHLGLGQQTTVYMCTWQLSHLSTVS
jgi:hypothetical protein